MRTHAVLKAGVKTRTAGPFAGPTALHTRAHVHTYKNTGRCGRDDFARDAPPKRAGTVRRRAAKRH